MDMETQSLDLDTISWYLIWSWLINSQHSQYNGGYQYVNGAQAVLCHPQKFLIIHGEATEGNPPDLCNYLIWNNAQGRVSQHDKPLNRETMHYKYHHTHHQNQPTFCIEGCSFIKSISDLSAVVICSAVLLPKCASYWSAVTSEVKPFDASAQTQLVAC